MLFFLRWVGVSVGDLLKGLFGARRAFLLGGLVGGAVGGVARVVDDRVGLVSFALLPYVAFRVRGLGLGEVLDRLFARARDPVRLFRPMQVRWEIERLLEVLEGLRPKYVLEIGTARGGTLLLWTRVAADDALIISIDLPGGPFGGGYPALKGLAYKAFARGKQRVVLIRGDSHDARTVRKVLKVLGGAKLDFLFIDGDHTYEGVRRDFETYAPLVREGGVIAIHDIVPGPEGLVGGVPRFWRELKEVGVAEGLEMMEIVRDWGQGGYGIGVVIKQYGGSGL